jgi:hypothetical protein
LSMTISSNVAFKMKYSKDSNTKNG